MTSEIDDDLPTIPDQVRSVMRDEEIENMQNLDGWATGTVTRVKNGRSVATIEDAWIELFNGEGLAGEFGGVRFVAVDRDGTFQEAYTYATRSALDGNEPGWFVLAWDAPSNPVYGKAGPEHDFTGII